MPSMLNIRAASGDGWGGASVDLGDRYSRNGEERVSGRILELGKNFNA